MNWQAIDAIGGMLGAIGVIVTLIYLAIQLRQNTRAYQIAAVQEAMENSAKFSELVASDNEIGETFWLGLMNPEKLTATDTRRFVSILNVFMRRESVAYYLYKQGTMPEELWNARVRALTGALNQPGLKLYLESSADSLPVEFREFISDIASKESTMSESTRRLFTGDKP